MIVTPENWQVYDPCPHCGSDRLGRIAKVEDVIAVEDGQPVVAKHEETIEVTSMWCKNCGQLLLEDGDVVAGEAQ